MEEGQAGMGKMQKLNFTGHRRHVCVCGRKHVLGV